MDELQGRYVIDKSEKKRPRRMQVKLGGSGSHKGNEGGHGGKGPFPYVKNEHKIKLIMTKKRAKRNSSVKNGKEQSKSPQSERQPPSRIGWGTVDKGKKTFHTKGGRKKKAKKKYLRKIRN